ncbi:MAG: hypothetical protein JWP02_1575, partial [Acidimicrobiales bacterium]|nr:hypothetical protein [Acidimicrobiales bacterium]
ARAIARTTANPDCGVLPVAAAMNVPVDTLAVYAHAVGLGPEPRREMSQLARQQGNTFDERMLTDGTPLLARLEKDGWLSHTNIAVINVDDHVSPPTTKGLTSDGGKPTEHQWRAYLKQRDRYTREAHARALTEPEPTLLLRGVVDTSHIAGTAGCYGEFDYAIVYPPGVVPPSSEIQTLLGIDGSHEGRTVLGDAKSWRRLGPLDNGDKRAQVATQIGVYSASAKATWPATQAETVSSIALVLNPPGSGGLATGRLTSLDLADALRGLDNVPARHAIAVATAATMLQNVVADGGRLDLDDTTATTKAVNGLLTLSAWNPGCLSRCPLGQTCRRSVEQTGSLSRLGQTAAQAGPVAGIARLQQLRAGASPTTSEQTVATELDAARRRLGTPIPTPTAAPAAAPAVGS